MLKTNYKETRAMSVDAVFVTNMIILAMVQRFIPETFKILGWCPAGSVLPHGEKVPL